MEFVLAVFEFLDYGAFLSVWYWALVILAWALTCHYTMGVPYDVVVRADRLGGQHAADCDQLAMIHARRITNVMKRGGVFIVGAAAFTAASLATLGFWFGYEVAAAFFLILVPVGLVAALGARLSGKVLAQAVTGENLRKLISRRRFWDQVIGVLAICVTALFTGWHAVSDSLQASDGVDLGDVFMSLLAGWF
jgi:hypothetical protein